MQEGNQTSGIFDVRPPPPSGNDIHNNFAPFPLRKAILPSEVILYFLPKNESIFSVHVCHLKVQSSSQAFSHLHNFSSHLPPPWKVPGAGRSFWNSEARGRQLVLGAGLGKDVCFGVWVGPHLTFCALWLLQGLSAHPQLPGLPATASFWPPGLRCHSWPPVSSCSSPDDPWRAPWWNPQLLPEPSHPQGYGDVPGSPSCWVGCGWLSQATFSPDLPCRHSFTPVYSPASRPRVPRLPPAWAPGGKRGMAHPALGAAVLQLLFWRKTAMQLFQSVPCEMLTESI